MTTLETEIDTLHATIKRADPDTRHVHEPELRHLIERMRDADLAVPVRAVELHEMLLSEAIEAEFDNMPV